MWHTNPVADIKKKRNHGYSMGTTMKVILECNLLLLLGAKSHAATYDGLNAKPYGILCNIYNIAANPPTSLYDAAKVLAIRREIDAINVSLSDDAWFSEIASTDEVNKLSEEFKAKNDVSGGNYERWRTAVTSVSTGERFKKISSAGTTVRLAQLKLEKIEEQAAKIFRDIGKLQAAADLDPIKEKFEDAIGEKVGTTTNYGITSTARTSACGGASGAAGSVAGSNLIVDFLCLCAAHTDATCSGNRACGKECIETSGISNNWNSGTPTNAEAIWKALKAGCEAIPGPKRATPQHGYEAISKFFAELRVGKAGTSGSNYKTGLLGGCDGTSGCSTGCSGQQTANEGICVAYGTTDWENKITWLKNMKEGLELLQIAQNKSATIHHFATQLHMLQHRAEEIYYETAATLDQEKSSLEKPTQALSPKPSPSSPSDKTTAQEPGAASISPKPRFILPWTLLI